MRCVAFVCALSLLSLVHSMTLESHRNHVRGMVQKLSREQNQTLVDDSDNVVVTDDSPLAVDHVVGQFVHPRRHFFVYWIYQEDMVHFFIAAPYQSWIGIGFSYDMAMPVSDIIVGSLNKVYLQENVLSETSQPIISDRYTPKDTRSVPLVDSQQDVELIKGYFENQWTVLEFRRAVDTHDEDHDIRLNEALYLLWAVGPIGDEILEGGTGDFRMHSRRGVVKVHFPTGLAVHVDDLSREEAHASLMLYGWGLFAVISIFCARYMKDPLGSWWLVIHVTLAVMVFLLTISGFSVIISYVSKQNHNHFDSLHKILGLGVTVLMVAQVFLGLLTRAMYDEDREHAPFFPDRVHWWVGRLMTIGAFINLGSGLLLFAKSGKTPWILLLTWVLAIIIFVALFELHFRGDAPSRTAVAKEYQLLEMGVPLVRQDNNGLLFCFGSLCLTGVLLITLSVSLMER